MNRVLRANRLRRQDESVQLWELTFHFHRREFGLGGQLPIDSRLTAHLPQRMMMLEKRDGELELIARYDRSPELGFIDTGEHKQAAAFANYTQSEYRGGLSKRFEDQNTGHDRFAWKMAGEERFIDGNIL